MKDLKEVYAFIENRIAKENIGEHDGDNRFICEGVEHMMDAWQQDHEGCTPIGVCYEDPHPWSRGYYPMVYEDENGNRYYTHINIEYIHEYFDELMQITG